MFYNFPELQFSKEIFEKYYSRQAHHQAFRASALSMSLLCAYSTLSVNITENQYEKQRSIAVMRRG
jgi:hypothetical protein